MTAVQAGVIPLLTHGAFDFHVKHVLQPSDNLEKAVFPFKMGAEKRDAKTLARSQVPHLRIVCHLYRAACVAVL